MQLVGRDSELAAAARAVDAARRGSGRVLGVLGEAGIGKSALLAAIATRAREAGHLVIRGRGVEHERDVPFGVAVAALEEHIGALPPLSGAAERFHPHRAVRAAPEGLGRERPVALLLDDQHWADDASIELVLHLMRRPPAIGHLIVFAARPVGQAARLLDGARSAPGWEQLMLAPLGHDASLALLAGVGDAAARERLVREAAGNPLFLRELARAAPRPDGVAAHERAAAALERRGAAPVARAYHVARCAQPGDPAAIALLCDAAEASAGASPAATAHWFAAALRLTPDSEREQRSGLLGRLALALAAAGRLDEARTALLEALEHPAGRRFEIAVACARMETQLGRHAEARRRLLAERAHAARENLADLAVELAAVAFHTGRGDDVRAWAEPAVRAAEEAGRPVVLAGAQAFAALGRLWTGDPETAAALLDRATALLDELGDETLAETCVLGQMLVGVAQNLSERFTAASATSADAGDRPPDRAGAGTRHDPRPAGDHEPLPARARRRAAPRRQR